MNLKAKLPCFLRGSFALIFRCRIFRIII